MLTPARTGLAPTGIGLPTATFRDVSITDMVPAPKFDTYRCRPSGLTSTPLARSPTTIGLPTGVLAVASITQTCPGIELFVLPLQVFAGTSQLVTYTRWPSGLTARFCASVRVSLVARAT